MSRTAQDLLEFDKLRELLRLRTTSAPGRRAVNGLEPGMDRAALESAFALIREAAEWLRAGRELGFGALADSARAECGSGRRLRHAAQRPLRDSRAGRKSANNSRRGARSKRDGANGFHGTV